MDAECEPAVTGAISDGTTAFVGALSAGCVVSSAAPAGVGGASGDASVAGDVPVLFAFCVLSRSSALRLSRICAMADRAEACCASRLPLGGGALRPAGGAAAGVATGDGPTAAKVADRDCRTPPAGGAGAAPPLRAGVFTAAASASAHARSSSESLLPSSAEGCATAAAAAPASGAGHKQLPTGSKPAHGISATETAPPSARASRTHTMAAVHPAVRQGLAGTGAPGSTAGSVLGISRGGRDDISTGAADLLPDGLSDFGSMGSLDVSEGPLSLLAPSKHQANGLQDADPFAFLPRR